MRGWKKSIHFAAREVVSGYLRTIENIDNCPA